MVNTEPFPNWLVAETCPFIRSTMCRTMDNPKPVPPTCRERALSTR